LEHGFATIETRLGQIFANFPNRPVAWLLYLLVLPRGPRRRGPSDRLTEACASILMEPSAARDRLTVDLFHGSDGGLVLLERAFALKVASHDLRDRLRKARLRDIGKAREQGLINEAEFAELETMAKAIDAAIAVDDFAPEEITGRHALQGAMSQGAMSSRAMARPAAE
jgi:acyl-CoA dehydrogenase